MRWVHRFVGLGALAAVAAASVSCGKVIRDSRSDVILVVNDFVGRSGNPQSAGFTNTLLSDVVTFVTSPAPCSVTTPCQTVFNDVALATFHFELKNPGTPTVPTSASGVNQVIVDRYHVEYIRADGRNVQGVDVPYAWDGAMTFSVQPGAARSVTFEIVRHSAKVEPPLIQLVNSANVIATICRVTFYARDLAGNRMTATAQMEIDFGNFGDI